MPDESQDTPILPPHLYRHPIYPWIKFRPGFGPYPVTDPDPSFRTCMRNLNRGEYMTWTAMTAVPSYFGYRYARKEITVKIAIVL